MSESITIADLSVRYGRGPAVLEDVNACFAAGAIHGLLGPNGAGKSTLLHAMMGLVPVSTGEVLLGTRSLKDRATLDVGFCGDDTPMPDLLTGLEYVEMVQALRGLRPSRVLIEEAFASLAMGDAAHRLIHTYSHGMKRKTQLIAHVMHRPQALILDEPFRGLDPETAAMLRGLLHAYAARGRIVLVSTHDLAVAQQMCASVTVVARGGVRLSGSVAELLAESPDGTLEERFLAVTGLDEAVESETRAFLELVESA